MPKIGVIARVGLVAFGFATLAAAPASGQVSCGDVITAGTTLTSSDPVVNTPCRRNGIVIGKTGSEPPAVITLDCALLIIKGSGTGIGIRVRKGVVAVIQDCVVDGFKTGIQAAGGTAIDNSIVLNSAEDGVTLGGKGNSASGVVSQNNGGAGFVITSRDSTLDANMAMDNGKAGFVVKGQAHTLNDNLALSNGEDGFTGRGNGFVVSSNLALDNTGNGFLFTGGTKREPNAFDTNEAWGNGGSGLLVKGRYGKDDGGNVGSTNAGPIQCEIGGAACDP